MKKQWKKPTRAQVGQEFLNYLVLTLGTIMTALSFNLFLIPNKIAPGGLSGLATVLFHQFGFPVGITTLVLNIPLFLLAIRVLGASFGIKTLYATLLLSLVIDTTTWLPLVTTDLFLASLIGGAMMGLGLGIIIMKKATTGGTEMAAMILHKLLPFISIGRLLLLIDFLIVLYATIAFQNYELGLYAVVTLFVCAKIVDWTVEGVDFAKAVYIISDKTDEISQFLLSMDRGVTALKGTGMWTGDEKDVLLCIVRKRELPKVKESVKSIDPRAFIFVAHVTEALGEGFKEDY